MKKHLYLLLPLITPTPSMAMFSWFFEQPQPTNTTKKIVTSTIIASTLVLSHKKYNKTLSLDLHQAVEQNNTTHALQLITNSQVDINAKVDVGTRESQKGWTPLIACARNGDDALPIAQALLKHQHINVNLQDNDGWTPLIWCAYKGDQSLKIAQALLGHQHINVNLQEKDGYTPLLVCAWKGDDDLHIAQALLGHQHINVNLQNNNGWTPLIRCCKTGDGALHIAQALLKRKDIKVNLQNNNGWTPLLVCAWKGDDALQIAQALLKLKDINVNLQNNKGFTPLMMCCQEGKKSLKIAQALLKRKEINVNLQNNDGGTPLDKIIEQIQETKQCTWMKNYKYVQLWNLLVAQGGILNKCKADYQNLKPSDFKEPQKDYVQAIKNNPPKNCIHHDTLYQAIKQGNTTLAQNLINKPYVDVNAKTNGTTPLIQCCKTGDKSLHIAHALLGHQHINVNLQNNEGWTPLIRCCKTGDGALHIAQELLGHQHINVNLQNNDGRTPLDSIIYWIKDNKKNYKYVQLWNLLVAQGGILDKCKADYENLKPSDFNEPQKGYVQAIKNNPFMIISLKLSSLTQENERQRKQLEKLQKTSTQQLDHKNNTIDKLKDQTQRLNKQLVTANQLKDKQQQTIQQQNETINTHLNTINKQKNTIQHNNKDIHKLKDQTQRLNNQLATANQLKDKQQQTLQQQNETINTHLNTIDNQKNTIQHKNKDIHDLKDLQKRSLPLKNFF